MATKYVENKHKSNITCKYTGDSGEVSIEFRPFMLDKYTGKPASTGFTSVSTEALKLLKDQSKVFNAFVRDNLLVVVDNVPASLLTPSDLISEKVAIIGEKIAIIAERDKVIEEQQAVIAKLTAEVARLAAEKADAADDAADDDTADDTDASGKDL